MEKILLKISENRWLVKLGDECYCIKTIEENVSIFYRGVDNKFDDREILNAVKNDKQGG